MKLRASPSSLGTSIPTTVFIGLSRKNLIGDMSLRRHGLTPYYLSHQNFLTWILSTFVRTLALYTMFYIKNQSSSNSIIPKYLPFHFTSRESNVVLPRIVCRVGDIDGGKILWLRGEGALLEQVSFHLETGKIERTTTFIWLRILLDRE